MDIVDRLIAYRNHTGLTSSQFADQAGIPRPTLSQFLNGRNKRLSDDMTGKLHQAYPDLNIMWLLFGEGDMLSNSNIEISEGKIDENSHLSDSQFIDNKNIPLQETGFEFNHIPETNQKTQAENRDSCPNSSPAIQKMEELPTDPQKKIREIVVFYTDNSYETFRPSEK